MKYLMWMVLLLPLAGCSDKVAIPMINSTGDVVTGVAPVIADSSVLKEREVMATLRNRDKQYTTAYKESGLDMAFAMVDVAPGVKAYLPTKISFKALPEFKQPLPTKPSEHPVWAFLDHTFSTGLKYGFIWAGVDSVTSALSSASSDYSYYFNKDVVADNSFNMSTLGITGSSSVTSSIGLTNDKSSTDDHTDNSTAASSGASE